MYNIVENNYYTNYHIWTSINSLWWADSRRPHWILNIIFITSILDMSKNDSLYSANPHSSDENSINVQPFFAYINIHGLIS